MVRSRRITESKTTYKWTNHPSHQDSLLAFRSGRVHVWAWSDVVQTETIMFPSRVIYNLNSLTRSRASSSTNLWESRENIEQVLVTLDKTFVLVQFSCPIGPARNRKKLFYSTSQPSHTPPTSDLPPPLKNNPRPDPTVRPPASDPTQFTQLQVPTTSTPSLQTSYPTSPSPFPSSPTTT